MLTITVMQDELFDEEAETFSYVGGLELSFEHSLISLSKWESKYQKPFLGQGKKTTEEVFGYLECMCLTPGIAPEVFYKLAERDIDRINAYVESNQTATTFGSLPTDNNGRAETITSELVYYWLVAFTIPFEVETWHLNRLFSLIRICSIKSSNSKENKLSASQIADRNRRINEQRLKEFNTTG